MERSIKKLNYSTIFLVIVTAMLAGSCAKIHYHQLTEADMAWLVYKNNEVDEFISGSNQIATYNVALRTKTYTGDNDNYNEFTTATFQLMNDTTAFTPTDSKGELFIYKQDDDGLLVTLTWPHYPYKEVPLTSMPYNVVTIGGVNYFDVFILDATGATDARYYIEKIWYSQSEGVIQYEDASGEVWIRTN